MGWFSNLFGSKPAAKAKAKPRAPRQPPRQRPSFPPGLRVISRRGFPRPVVGESRYQDALERICGGHNREGHQFDCVAQLTPEPENPHDKNAVRIEIAGAKVGYLGRQDAEKYLAALADAGHAGQPAYAEARIVGGWKRNQHEAGAGHFGVTLGVPFPIKFEG